MILETNLLTKRFGGINAVSDVSIKIREGSVVSIIGPNGAGKTTLFNLLTGHLKPDAGKILFNGKDITGLSPHIISRLGIGRSFQRINIFPNLTVLENIQISIFASKKMSNRIMVNARTVALSETELILSNLSLLQYRDQKAGLLSHGDQKRLELGIALAMQPKLLLLDEPTQGMSPQETTETTELISRLVREREMTLIFVEHDMNVVFGISEEIIVLYQGKVLCAGKPEEIKNNDEVQKIYLGDQTL